MSLNLYNYYKSGSDLFLFSSTQRLTERLARKIQDLFKGSIKKDNIFFICLYVWQFDTKTTVNIIQNQSYMSFNSLHSKTTASVIKTLYTRAFKKNRSTTYTLNRHLNHCEYEISSQHRFFFSEIVSAVKFVDRMLNAWTSELTTVTDIQTQKNTESLI